MPLSKITIPSSPNPPLVLTFLIPSNRKEKNNMKVDIYRWRNSLRLRRHLEEVNYSVFRRRPIVTFGLLGHDEWRSPDVFSNFHISEQKAGVYDTGEHNGECGVLRPAEAHSTGGEAEARLWVTDQSPSQLCPARRPGRSQHHCSGDPTLHSVRNTLYWLAMAGIYAG